MKEFLNNIPIFLIKGFILFLGFGLLIEIIDNEFMNKLISSSSWGIKFLFFFSVGLVAHYTFWKTYD
jgi:ABC-type Mn2+/Zn2+ transport system permease subunit